MSVSLVNKNRIKKTKADKTFDFCNVLIMLLLILIMAYPLYFIIIASLSDPYKVINGKVYLWPVDFTLDSYVNVFRESSIWKGYYNTVKYTFWGTLFNLALTIPAAYILSKKKLAGRKFLSFYFLIPMYFSGGLVPTYLQVNKLGLMNKPYTLIFLGGISIYNLIVTRIFFSNLHSRRAL